MTWLFLRGLVRSSFHWNDFPQKFAEATKHKVVCIDYPGIGDCGHIPCPLTMNQLVEYFRGSLKKQFNDLSEVNVLGLSLGGMVSLSWIDSYPYDFKRAVIINSSASNLSYPWQRMRPLALQHFLKAALSKSSYDRERNILRMTSNLNSHNNEIIESWAKYEKKHPVKASTLFTQLKIAGTFKAPEKVNIPLLILGSQSDQLVESSCSENLAGLYNAKHFTHPEAGHDLPLDDPDWVIEKVLGFASPQSS
jgi:pimeloyl-ACP methyl ester carboxylesterase